MTEEQQFKIMQKHSDNLYGFSEKILGKYRQTLQKVEQNLFAQLYALLGSINLDDADVTQLIAAIDNIYIQIINSPQFVNDTAAFLRNFDQIRANTLELHKEVNNLNYDNIFLTKLDKQQTFLIDKTLYDLKQGGLKKYFVEDAKKILLETVHLGYSQKQIERRLRERFLTTAEKDSYYMRYATQVSRDSINQYNGQVNQMVADEYGLDGIRYVGSIVEDSRPFCTHIRKDLKGKITKKELPLLLKRYKGSSGMMDNTTPANFLFVRGGFNCRHEAIPYRITQN